MTPSSWTADDDPPASVDQRPNSIIAPRTDMAVCQSDQHEQTDVVPQADHSKATCSTFEERRGFLDLPCEVRQQIYHYIFRGTQYVLDSEWLGWPTPISYCTKHSIQRALRVTCTCRTVHNEAVAILAKEVRYTMSLRGLANMGVHNVLRTVYFPHLQYLRLGITPADFDSSMFPNLKELSFAQDLGLMEDFFEVVDSFRLSANTYKGGPSLCDFVAPLSGASDDAIIAQVDGGCL
ncbi:uncharacterized protein AB675_1252 [Cyphellophora attinorum]|uniref:Uncharacterized protein n=1 Tax=Cyphellophora attinorum TaxID=1664694 RepID=A0A0N1H3W2_9EURO|nr:uncharacterized protein AB675_1252 [Phialophora attinorum]KPI35676.1 hypothetical protein AB675_1252 [Phialophora attinorum]